MKTRYFLRSAARSIAVVLFCSLFLLCCSRKESRAADSGTVQDASLAGMRYVRSIPNTYAKMFSVDEYEGGFRLVTVNGSMRYLLVPEGASAPQSLPQDITVLQQPFDALYLASSPVMALMCRAGALPQVKFCSTAADKWYIPEAVEAMRSGAVRYVGKYDSPDFELLLSEGADIAVESAMIFHKPQVQEKLESLGIPVFVDESSYEDHPLGRVEWVRLYGMFMGKEAVAESFFAEQVQMIAPLEKEAALGKGVAFFYVNSDGMAVVRGTDDYIARMIGIAGGSYACAGIPESKTDSSTVQLSMEEFYQSARDADFLVYNTTIDKSVKSLDDLLAKNSVFADFKAVKEHQVWASKNYLYQGTDNLAGFIMEMRQVLTDNAGADKAAADMLFLEHLE